ncbi:hypothetical protein B0H13DRAFT_1879901 [Mycena leptocephala]|nr:hypothetical protein B0H13DRAFT_1879901 [Mycena leptocephala]
MRMEMRNVADAGMMARLLLAEKHPKQAYSNLSLETSVEEALGFSIEKDLAQSDWSAKQLTRNRLNANAARDAVASLHLYQILKVRLEDEREEIGTAIPEGWYTFNSRLGDPMRTRLAADGTEVIWKPSDCTCDYVHWIIGDLNHLAKQKDIANGKFEAAGMGGAMWSGMGDDMRK